MPAIKNITIENFKAFKHKTSFDIAPITLLIGPNGSGKSAFTSALEFLDLESQKKSFYDFEMNDFKYKEYNKLNNNSENDYKNLKSSKNEILISVLISGFETFYLCKDVSEFELKMRYTINNDYLELKDYDIFEYENYLLSESSHTTFGENEDYAPFQVNFNIKSLKANLSNIINGWKTNSNFEKCWELNHQITKYNIKFDLNIEANNIDYDILLQKINAITNINLPSNAIKGNYKTGSAIFISEDINEYIFDVLVNLVLLEKEKLINHIFNNTKKEQFKKINSDIKNSTNFLFEDYPNLKNIKNKLFENNPSFKKIFKILGYDYEILIEENKTFSFQIKVKKNDTEQDFNKIGYGFLKLLPLILELSNLYDYSNRTKFDDYSDKIKDKHGDIDFGDLMGVKSGDGKINRFGYLLIEEPEANLHPALQSKLADLFSFLTSITNDTFIIETHSEYMLRKFQYLVAKGELNPDDIIIHYFNHPDDPDVQSGKLPHAKQIQILKDGSLSDDFGPGFYDESDRIAMDLFNLKFKN